MPHQPRMTIKNKNSHSKIDTENNSSFIYYYILSSSNITNYFQKHNIIYLKFQYIPPHILLYALQTAARERCIRHFLRKLLLAHRQPLLGTHLLRCKSRCKPLAHSPLRPLVVRTHALTLVAPENPAMQLRRRLASLNGRTRYAPRRVDVPFPNRPIRTRLHTPPARSAPDRP